MDGFNCQTRGFAELQGGLSKALVSYCEEAAGASEGGRWRVSSSWNSMISYFPGGEEKPEMDEIPQQGTSTLALAKLCDSSNANELNVYGLHFPFKTSQLEEIRERAFTGKPLSIQDPPEPPGALSGREQRFL